jgi:hypothetical protein
MTISELINHLQELDGDLEVYIQGYECGFVDVTKDNIEPIEVCRDYYKPDGNWWDGDHEDAHAVGRVDYLEKYDIKKGIVLGR